MPEGGCGSKVCFLELCCHGCVSRILGCSCCVASTSRLLRQLVNKQRICVEHVQLEPSTGKGGVVKPLYYLPGVEEQELEEVRHEAIEAWTAMVHRRMVRRGHLMHL